MLIILSLLAVASAAPATASSFAETESGRATADLAVDGLLSTGWAEGAAGDGDGEWIEIDLGHATELHSVSIWPGDMTRGKRSFRESGRPKLIRLLVDGQQQGEAVRLLDQMQRLDLPVDVTGRKLRVVVDEAYGGGVFSNTYIAEIAVNFPDPGPKDGAWQAYLQSSAAQRASQQFDADLLEHYQAYKAAQFGDRDALAWISDAAAEGEPWIRKAAARRVSVGYRAQAIVSAPRAQEALRKLKDANAIPALEMAMLRATGEQRQVLSETVEIFYAYQELVGNKDRIAPPWGESGFWKGALRGFDEPLAIEGDADGNLYVADTGNSRVQRFGSNGLVTKVFGGEPDIANAWFEEGRKFYVSGSAPSDAPGHFTNPVDLELIPGKMGTGMAVLDATRRVQVFDASGATTAAWTVDSENVLRPGRGGTGYLAWLPKKGHLLVFIGDEAITYDLQGTELGRWDVQHGTPSAVEVMKNGTLMLAFQNQVWQYSDDGFPHSVRADRDILGRGFEDLDLTVDDDGKLWVLTDDGVIHKFKKPGKLDFQVAVTDGSLGHQRFVVSDGMAWITYDDQIIRVDAYQKWLDAQSAAEGDDNGQLDLDPVGQ
ncbi:MAG: hypothetical protein GXP62_22140 [Oligoflexia bacterium]|nr:hypothetical protein [Oligoflexia bacterium]